MLVHFIETSLYEVAMTTTENTSEIPKLLLSILYAVNPNNHDWIYTIVDIITL